MNTRNGSEIFQLDDVVKNYAYRGGVTQAVRGVSLCGAPGEFIVVLGPSGSGKTTMLSLLAGLVRPTSGAVRLFGRDISGMPQNDLQRLRACRMGFVFQTFHLFDVLKVVENITLVQRFASADRGTAGGRALELLAQLGILDLAKKYPAELSQGQKQRVAIARALANSPSLLLADEPTASLEWHQGQEVVSLLRRCAVDLGCCVVCATHDLRMRDVAGRTCTMEDGVLTEEAARAPLVAVL